MSRATWTKLGTFDADYDFDGGYGLHRWIDEEKDYLYMAVYSSNGHPVSEVEWDDYDDAIREVLFLQAVDAEVAR